jgi:hypothetical protein
MGMGSMSPLFAQGELPGNGDIGREGITSEARGNSSIQRALQRLRAHKIPRLQQVVN